MNSVHDMGGMHGLGPVAPEGEEAPVFHHAWEARTHALVLASPTRGNIDVGRHRREKIPGPDYLRMTSSEKWLEGLCRDTIVVSHGNISRTVRGILLGLDQAVIPKLDVPQDKVLRLTPDNAEWL